MNALGLPIVLIADDDPGDRTLLQEAFEAADVKVDLRLVVDGKEFLDYLHNRAPWERAERPDLILLDLNMPQVNGREALREIKQDPNLRSIPVVVLTTSQNPKDITMAYEAGANSYIPKPTSFEDLAVAVRILCEFWFKLCLVPRTAQF